MEVDIKEPVVHGNQVIVWQDMGYSALYTAPDSGQAKWGGWTLEGLKAYKDLQSKNKAACATPESAALEAKILELVRKKNGCQAATYAEEKKSAKRKCTKEPASVEQIDLSDDEE